MKTLSGLFRPVPPRSNRPAAIRSTGLEKDRNRGAFGGSQAFPGAEKRLKKDEIALLAESPPPLFFSLEAFEARGFFYLFNNEEFLKTLDEE